MSNLYKSIIDADLASLFRTKNLWDLIEVLRAHVKKFDVNALEIVCKASIVFSSQCYTLL